jgi:hypothetical protein
MSNVSTVNGQIVDSLEVIAQNTLSANANKLSGAGKAFQSVSQSSAIAVQDATDNLRNVSTMATTAMGVAMAQMLATGQVGNYGEIIENATKMMTASTEFFGTVGNKASALVDTFPAGD